MMNIYNSLTRKVEQFIPLVPNQAGIYTCGPTVYDYATIGNWRTYVTSDLLVRTFRYKGYQVNYLMNITDVGHLTGDNLGDADTGKDKIEKAARKERRSAWDIAGFYEAKFREEFRKLNLIEPSKFPRATEHIEEQKELIQTILEKGFAYPISDGIYFDSKAYEAAGNMPSELSTLDEIKEGARVKPNPEKKHPRDFALWKFSPKGEQRQMEWDFDFALHKKLSFSLGKNNRYQSEIHIDKEGRQNISGKGFPGWHIECSAMSMKYLGEQFDIHAGGEDLKSTHHPNEILQSEAASGRKPFVRYWVHGAFLLVEGGKMGKSLGNAFNLSDIEERGFEPLALRYFYLTGHYRRQLNFTWKALESSAKALNKLKESAAELRSQRVRTSLSEEKLSKVENFRNKFEAALDNDLNIPEALSTAWEVVKSNIPGYDKYDLLMDFDQVLGLGLALSSSRIVEFGDLPGAVQALVKEREKLRAEKNFKEADRIRDKIDEMGYSAEDSEGGPRFRVKYVI